MYQAKAADGNGIRLDTFQTNQTFQRRAHLGAGLRHAIDKNQSQLFLQPQVDIATRCLMGCDALLRWQNDDGEFIAPDQFIPVAESSGLIVPIGDWVMDRAIVLLSQWRQPACRRRWDQARTGRFRHWLQVLAEGVDNKDQLDQLARLHCNLAQGYPFSPSLPNKLFAERSLTAAKPGLAGCAVPLFGSASRPAIQSVDLAWATGMRRSSR